jgi:Fic family protein
VSSRPAYQLYETQEEKAALEMRNGLFLFEAIEGMVRQAGPGLALTGQTLRSLHEILIRDIYTCAGQFREVNVEITHNSYQPPEWQRVPELVEEMCAYVNANRGKGPIHGAAYLLWRHNWIHPFNGGNGRTSRNAAYLVLSARLGFCLPGRRTVPQQIVENRDAYYRALQAADAAALKGRVDVSEMETMLSEMLREQLLSVGEQGALREL